MNKLLILSIIVSLLMGCAAHKVSLDERAIALKNAESLRITQKPIGIPHCGAHYLPVITVGIIPAVCEREFDVRPESFDTTTEGVATVTFVQGWVSLLLAVSPNWSFDSIELEKHIESKIRESK